MPKNVAIALLADLLPYSYLNDLRGKEDEEDRPDAFSSRPEAVYFQKLRQEWLRRAFALLDYREREIIGGF